MRKLGRFEEAVDDYSNEIEMGPLSMVKAYNNRAYAFAKLNRYTDAVRDYSKVLQY